MVLFFITLLGVSIVGLSCLVGIRRYELSSGRVIFSRVRPTAGEWLGRGLHFFERVAPATVRYFALRLYRQGRLVAHRSVAWILLHAERLLEQTLLALRQKPAVKEGGEASAFLREVAEHKEQLKKSAEERAIYEE